ncbi:hypothetical protein QNH46_09050 [Paenibacillus woosongensis]|uniref:Deoxycytidine triphosphate deaminase n=1 Tax=Paenibacillus woosongensis TaxID=307580 RepID=A0AA95IAD0_9BACL|nr:hypothetical protein [Paenibacillus woosongensis]WHX50773.1 hypothetical protein QNH46_09050 [Paenibacillus woosongensis]
MILTGKEIEKQVSHKNIIIEPFDPSCINPNSYNYKLGDQIIELSRDVSLLNAMSQDDYQEIPKEGFLLKPGQVYLASTHEIIGSNKFVTSLIGRSSVGRLGLYLQISADLGNLGPAHKWTLELVCVQPIKVYPRMKVGQVSFWKPYGDINEYNGQYTSYHKPQICLFDSLHKIGSDTLDNKMRGNDA